MTARWIWLTHLETSEPVGIPIDKIAMIEQKEPHTGNVIVIFLESGKEIRVVESLTHIRNVLEGALSES